jgi:hypothetical protein
MTIAPRQLAGVQLTLLIAAACAAMPVHAQQLSVVRAGSFEIDPFAGLSYGIDKTRFMGGGNVSFAVSKVILPYVEYSYFPGIARQQSGTFSGTGASFVETYSVPLSDFHGGVHIRIPIHESPIVPYGVFGVGGLTHLQHTETATYVSSGTTYQVTGLIAPGGTDLAVNFGGGLRYYVNQRWGFRAEAKAYKPTGGLSPIFGKVEVGFFYQLR